jgi:hypothetical protein
MMFSEIASVSYNTQNSVGKIRIIVTLNFHVGAATLPRGIVKCAERRTHRKYHAAFLDDVHQHGGHVRSNYALQLRNMNWA